MRKYIDIVKQNLTEGEVVPFTPSDKGRTISGGAQVYQMQDVQLKAKLEASLDEFDLGYLTAMLWTDEEELGAASIEDISPEALQAAKHDCDAFKKEVGSEVLHAYGASQAGHDFWLTRNHHGAGFWEADHCDEETGDRLTKISHQFGEVYTYRGDDGLIWC